MLKKEKASPNRPESRLSQNLTKESNKENVRFPKKHMETQNNRSILSPNNRIVNEPGKENSLKENKRKSVVVDEIKGCKASKEYY